jgi:hypothetical protein
MNTNESLAKSLVWLTLFYLAPFAIILWAMVAIAARHPMP